MLKRVCLILALPLAFAGVAGADTLTLSGRLNDPTNPALKWSDLGPALFGDDWEIANNVAIYDLAIPTAGSVRFLSLGFATGGVDPYFTLFDGTGNPATFLGSNYAQAFSTGGDFDLTFSLAAGAYTAVIGAFANLSFAENLGCCALGDGFIQLGTPGSLGDYHYEVEVTYPGRPVPEPSSGLLLVVGLASVWLRRRRT